MHRYQKSTDLTPMQQYPSPHYTHSNPPPPQKIINSKDQAIQQLINQNTSLKRQLSSIILKASTPQTSAFHSTLNSPSKNKDNSRAQFSSHRNSMEKIDVNMTNKFTLNNYIVGQAKIANVTNYGEILRQGLSCRNSAVNIGTDLKLVYSPVTNNKMFGGLQNRNLQRASQNINIQALPVTFNPIRSETKTQKSQPINNLNLNKTQSPQQEQLNEEELYRQKMMKLKGKKSPRSIHAKSQQKYIQDSKDLKSTSIPVQDSQNKTSIQQDQIKQLVNAHKVLKSKLDSQSQENSRNVKVTVQLKETTSQQTDKIDINCPITQRKNIDDAKKLPRYIPKNFSIQKQNRKQLNPPKKNKLQKKAEKFSEKLSQKQVEKQLEKTSDKYPLKSHLRHNTQLPSQQAQILSSKQQQKKICLRDLRGRVYLDAQEGSKTRRTISKSNNLSSNDQHFHQFQNITRNQRIEEQLTRRVNPVQSKDMNLTADSLKRFQCDINRNSEGKSLMRKNSNKVYLQEQVNEKISNKHSESYYKMEGDRQQVTINKPELTRNIVRKINQQEISSIEQIHQIFQDSYFNDNVIDSSSRNSPVGNNTSPSHIMTGSPIAKVALVKKGLHNQIYCSEESKTDIK